MELPTAAYVILGMLRLGERTGYDIKRRVQQSTRYFSTISDAQIYPLLEQLEEARLVEGRAEPRGKRRRRVFELTADGEAALRDWVRGDEPLILDVRDVGLMRLFFADAIDEDEALQVLRAMRSRSQRILGELRTGSEPAAREAQRRGHRFPLLTLGFGEAMHQAWIDYCDTLEERLRGGSGE